MPETASTLDKHVRETIADELKLVDVLVVTEAVELRRHYEAGKMPGARLVVVTDPSALLTDADKLVLEIARAGKEVRTWCAPTSARPPRGQRDGANAESVLAERQTVCGI